MVGRLVVLCVVEVVVAAVLAVQVFGGRGTAPEPVGTALAPPPVPEQPAAGRAGTLPVPSPAAERTADAASVQREHVAAKWRADDPVGVLLMGTLRTVGGMPADATLSLVRDQVRKGASAAADGGYAVAGLSPGEWQVTVRGDAFVQVETTLQLGDAAVQQRDFVLEPSFPVRVVIVTPDGADGTRALRMALSGWSDFHVAGQREPFPERLAPTDYGAVFVGDARWSSEMNPRDGAAGTLCLASLPAHVALLQRHLVLQQQLVRPGQDEVKFVVDVDALRALAASASVRVLDASTGEPLAKARVALHTSNRGGMGNTVDADGRAVVEGLSPGFLQCTIAAPEHETFFHTVRVAPGERLELGDVRLGPAEPLAGTVLGPDGKPAGASLRWTELKWRTSPAAFSHNRSAGTEADGSFKLWGTGRGTIAVQARGSDGLVAAGVFDNPPAEPVVLQLARPSVCTVTRPPDPTRAFTLTLFDARGRAIAGHALEPRATKTTVSLPAGEYTFEVHDEQGRLVQSGSLVFGAEPCVLEVR